MTTKNNGEVMTYERALAGFPSFEKASELLKKAPEDRKAAWKALLKSPIGAFTGSSAILFLKFAKEFGGERIPALAALNKLDGEGEQRRAFVLKCASLIHGMPELLRDRGANADFADALATYVSKPTSQDLLAEQLAFASRAIRLTGLNTSSFRQSLTRDNHLLFLEGEVLEIGVNVKGERAEKATKGEEELAI